jgi:chromosome segregation ATPase
VRQGLAFVLDTKSRRQQQRIIGELRHKLHKAKVEAQQHLAILASTKSAGQKLEQETAELRQRCQELEANNTALRQGTAAKLSLQASEAHAALKSQQKSDAPIADLEAELLAHQVGAPQAQKQQQCPQTTALDAKCATLKAQNAALVAQLDISRQQTIDAQASVQSQTSAAQMLLNALLGKSAVADEYARQVQGLQSQIWQLKFEQAGWASCVEALCRKLMFSSDSRCSLLVAALAAEDSSLALASIRHAFLQESETATHEAQHWLPWQPRTPTFSQDMSAASYSSFSSFGS